MEEVDYVDDGVLHNQREASDQEHFFQFHVGGDFGLQFGKRQIMRLLRLHGRNYLGEREIIVLDIDAQVHIGGEVPDGAALVNRP